MRQRTARNTAWMDAERVFRDRWDLHRVRLQPDPYIAIGASRREQVARVVARGRAAGRNLQVCRYALSAEGVAPRSSLALLGRFAAQQGWVAAPQRALTDHAGLPDEVRPGWDRVRELVRCGFVDGVVVLAASVISECADVYRCELDWFEDHLAFIALIVPEAPARRDT